MTDAEQTPPTGEVRKEPKIIKRYTNRKLYDTVESRYVTLEEISEMIKDGLEVRIIDNRSKEDLTAVTLAQIIFEEEKKRSRMPLGMLRDIIRHGGEALSGFLQQQVGTRVASIREEAEGLRERLLGQKLEGEVPPDAPNSAARPRAIEQAKELIAQSRRTFEEWQRTIDERVRTTVEGITSLPALGKDLVALEKKIAELEKKLDEMEKTGTPPGPPPQA